MTDIANPRDFFVTRDEDDNLQPVEQPLPGVEESIRVIPMTLGDLNKYGAEGGQLDLTTLDAEQLAEIFNTHLADVALDDDFEITEEMIEEDMIGFGRDAVLTAILRASGYDMQNAINLENLEMLNQVDDLGKFLELAEQMKQND